MSKPQTSGRGERSDPARAVLDQLRPLAEAMDPEFAFVSGRMKPEFPSFAGRADMLRLDLAVVIHALARAGATGDVHRALDRVKSSSRRGPLRAIALAQAERGEADAARQTARE